MMSPQTEPKWPAINRSQAERCAMGKALSSLTPLYSTHFSFLHIHWALDKFDMTGSTYQLVNGICLVATYVHRRLARTLYLFGTPPDIALRVRFFGGRIVYGLYNTSVLWSLLEHPAIEPGARWGIRLANLSLAGTNDRLFRPKSPRAD